MARGRGNHNNDPGPTTGPTTHRGATAVKVAAKAAPKGASKKTASKKSKDVPKNKKIAAPTAPLDEETDQPEYTAQAASINDKTDEQEDAFLRDQTPEIREGTEEDMILENDSNLPPITPSPPREESPPHKHEKSLVKQDGPAPPPPVEHEIPPPVEKDGPALPLPIEKESPAPPPPIEQEGPVSPPPVKPDGPALLPPVEEAGWPSASPPVEHEGPALLPPIEEGRPVPPPPVEQEGPASPPPVKLNGPAPPPPVEHESPAPLPPVEQEDQAPPPPIEHEGPAPLPPVTQDGPASPPPVKQDGPAPALPSSRMARHLPCPPVKQDGPAPPLPLEQDGPAPPPPVEQEGPAPAPPIEHEGPAPPPPVEQEGPAPAPPVEHEGPAPPPPVKQDVPPPPPPPPVGANVPPPSAPPPPPPPVEQENGGAPSTPAANPHAKSRGDPVLTLDGATWADRNAEAPKNPVRERVKAPQGEAEKASQKDRKKQRAEEDEAYQIALTNFDLEMDVKAEEIAEKFHKDVDDVQRAIRAVSFMATDRAVNLQNAKMWKVRTEVNDPLPSREKHLMRDLQKMVREDPRFQNMMDKDEEALIAEFEARPDKKVVGTRLSNAVAARDVTVFTKRIHHELCSLQKRTGAIGVCIIRRSSVSDMLLPVCIGPEEGRQYFPQVLRSTADQFALKFDHFTVNQGAAGLELGSNELRKAVTDGISDALEQRLGRKVTMKYGEYDQLVATHGVELVGWPEGIPFQGPSNLATVERLKPLHDALQANTLRWEVMSDTRKAEHKAAMANKEKKQRKERCDKDLDDEGEQRPKRIKKAVMAKMTAEEKTEHKHKMERERKARNRLARAEKDGKEIKKRKPGSHNDEERRKAKKARTSAKSSVKSKLIIDDDDEEYELPSKKKGKGKAKATPSEDEDKEEDKEDEESDPKKGSHALPYAPKPSKQYLAVNAAVQRGKKNKPLVARPRPRSLADPPVASTSQLPPPDPQCNQQQQHRRRGGGW
ncbi:hypothetical protein B0H13DRAFT_2384489 [Mycena leptocephala]|nr:hypothetical protein B0H13DRAFT_2384489 [Mycena leptocephala]